VVLLLHPIRSRNPVARHKMAATCTFDIRQSIYTLRPMLVLPAPARYQDVAQALMDEPPANFRFGDDAIVLQVCKNPDAAKAVKKIYENLPTSTVFEAGEHRLQVAMPKGADYELLNPAATDDQPVAMLRHGASITLKFKTAAAAAAACDGLEDLYEMVDEEAAKLAAEKAQEAAKLAAEKVAKLAAKKKGGATSASSSAAVAAAAADDDEEVDDKDVVKAKARATKKK